MAIKTVKLPVLEIFGPTIQGEGCMIGSKTIFIRFSGCDYSCVWCDSAFTWDGSQKPRMMTVNEITNSIEEKIGMNNFTNVTISGGNPALLPLTDLITQLKESFHKIISLETQGSKDQTWFSLIDQLTISPKPPSSKEQTNWEILDGILCKYEKNATLKVVVFDQADYQYAQKVRERYLHVPLFLQVGNSELSETKESKQFVEVLLNRLEWLIEQVVVDPIMNDVRVLPQLHTLIWGNKRGV